MVSLFVRTNLSVSCANGVTDFKFSEIEKAYAHFSRAAETKSLKVNIEF